MALLRRPSAFRSATAELVVAFALVAAVTAPARAQSLGPSLGDPKKCVVVVDDMGDVGFRISDAQVVADAVVSNLRKRIGFESVTYAGVAASAAAMKRLLATPEGAGPQDAQLKWFKDCEQSAPWRVRARFGTGKGNMHWVSASCRRAGADAKDVVEEKRFEAKTFLEARDKLAAAIPTFCPLIVSNVTVPIEGLKQGADAPDAGPPGMSKKQPPKPFTLPPRRE